MIQVAAAQIDAKTQTLRATYNNIERCKMSFCRFVTVSVAYSDILNQYFYVSLKNLRLVTFFVVRLI